MKLLRNIREQKRGEYSSSCLSVSLPLTSYTLFRVSFTLCLCLSVSSTRQNRGPEGERKIRNRVSVGLDPIISCPLSGSGYYYAIGPTEPEELSLLLLLLLLLLPGRLFCKSNRRTVLRWSSSVTSFSTRSQLLPWHRRALSKLSLSLSSPFSPLILLSKKERESEYPLFAL